MSPEDVTMDVTDNASPWPLLAGTVRARSRWGEVTVGFGLRRSRRSAERLAMEELERMEPENR